MGINFSRALTLKYGYSISNYLKTDRAVISVGRVMTCVLGMVSFSVYFLLLTSALPTDKYILLPFQSQYRHKWYQYPLDLIDRSRFQWKPDRNNDSSDTIKNGGVLWENLYL